MSDATPSLSEDRPRGGHLGQLTRHSGLLLVGDVLTRGLGFVLLPLYTGYLSDVDFGDWDTLLLAGTLLSLLAAHGMNSALLWAWRTGGTNGGAALDDAGRRQLVASVMGWSLLCNVVLCVAAFAFAQPLAELAVRRAGDERLGTLLRLVIAGLVLRNMTYPGEAVLKLRMQSRALMTMRLAEAGVALVGNVVTIAFLGMGLAGLAWAFFIAAIARLVVVVRAVGEMRRPRLQLALMPPLLRYGLPFLPQAMAFMALTMIDRVILKEYGLDAEAGVYSYGDRFARIVEFALISPLTAMWAAVMFNVAEEKDAQRQFARAATLWCAVGGLCAFVLTLLGGPLARLMDSSTGLVNPIDRLFATGGTFAGGARVIGVLAVGYVLYGLHDVARVGFAVTGRTRWMPVSVCTALVVNVVLNVWWIPIWGALGAAWATLAAYAWMNVFSLLLSERIYPQRWEWGRLLHVAAVLVGGTLLVRAFAPPDNTWAGLIVRLLAIALAPLVLWSTGFLRPDDQALVRAWLSRRAAALPGRRRS